jgi:hypothetical protein
MHLVRAEIARLWKHLRCCDSRRLGCYRRRCLGNCLGRSAEKGVNCYSCHELKRQQVTHSDNATVIVDSVGVMVNVLAVIIVVAVLHECLRVMLLASFDE